MSSMPLWVWHRHAASDSDISTNLPNFQEGTSLPHCDCNSFKTPVFVLIYLCPLVPKVLPKETSFPSVNCCGNLQVAGRINNKANYELLPGRSILDDFLASGGTLELPPRLSSPFQLFPSTYIIETTHQNVKPTTPADRPGCVSFLTTRSIPLPSLLASALPTLPLAGTRSDRTTNMMTQQASASLSPPASNPKSTSPTNEPSCHGSTLPSSLVPSPWACSTLVTAQPRFPPFASQASPCARSCMRCGRITGARSRSGSGDRPGSMIASGRRRWRCCCWRR